LALSKPEAPGLDAVQIAADGSIRGLDESYPQTDKDRNRAHDNEVTERGVILIARLLGLLLIFLGESLTFSLLQVQWPSAVFDDRNSRNRRNV